MKVRKHLRYICILLTLALLLGFMLSASAHAQTPDGMPPANEGICDALHAKGITPSLYGLCVTYCEALDCDLQQSQAANFTPQCKAAGRQILENYNALKKDTDPPMPCVQQQACPCWTAQEISAIGLTWSPHELDFFPNDFSPYYVSYSLVEIRTSSDGAYQSAGVSYYPGQQPAAQCVYTYYDALDPTKYIVRSQEISVPQADACKAQITQQVNSLGNDGVPVTCVGNLCP